MNRLRLVAFVYCLVLLFAASLNYLPFIPETDGKTFGIFALDIYDDGLHLASAIWAGLACWFGARASRFFLLYFGLIYFGDGLLGLITGSGYLDLGIFNYGIQDLPFTFKIMANLPHLALGSIAVLTSYLFRADAGYSGGGGLFRLIGRLLKWAFVVVILLLVGVASPIGYVEFFCRAEVKPNDYKPLIAEAEFRRAEANSYLTYPEWHIVYAYDELAQTLKTGDEYQFDYLSSVTKFWSSTCQLMKVADGHGGADGATRRMIYTIGASFNLEMGLKAAYEETIGRLFATIRGPQKTPQDQQALAMAVDYSAFLRQMPWYKYDFDKARQSLWVAPMTDMARGWERRLALGAEWKAKSYYASAIGAAVDATGQAQLKIRSVISGLPAETLKTIPNVAVISESPDGVQIETPRYDIFTHVLADIIAKGGTVREIAGNDDIMLSIDVPEGADYQGPGEVLYRMSRQGFASDRVLISLKVAELTSAFQQMQIADPGIEHVFDY